MATATDDRKVVQLTEWMKVAGNTCNGLSYGQVVQIPGFDDRKAMVGVITFDRNEVRHDGDDITLCPAGRKHPRNYARGYLSQLVDQGVLIPVMGTVTQE